MKICTQKIATYIITCMVHAHMLALWRWHSESTCSRSMVCQILRVCCDTRHFPWQMSYYDTKRFNCNGIAVIKITQVRHAHKFSTRCRVPNMLADMVPTNTHFLVLNQRHSVLCNDSKIMIVWFNFIVFNFSPPTPSFMNIHPHENLSHKILCPWNLCIYSTCTYMQRVFSKAILPSLPLLHVHVPFVPLQIPVSFTLSLLIFSLDTQDGFLDLGLYEQLLKNRVHVACSTSILQTHKSTEWPSLNKRSKLHENKTML